MSKRLLEPMLRNGHFFLRLLAYLTPRLFVSWICEFDSVSLLSLPAQDCLKVMLPFSLAMVAITHTYTSTKIAQARLLLLVNVTFLLILLWRFTYVCMYLFISIFPCSLIAISRLGLGFADDLLKNGSVEKQYM